MTDKINREVLVYEMAKAICQEQCAFYGEPPCWRISEEWGEHNHCDEPGCYALAKAAVSVVPE